MGIRMDYVIRISLRLWPIIYWYCVFLSTSIMHELVEPTNAYVNTTIVGDTSRRLFLLRI